MAGGKTEHQESAEGLGKVGEIAKKGWGRPQSGVNDIQGSDTGSTPLCLRDLDTFGDNEEDSGGDTHQVSESKRSAACITSLYIIYSTLGSAPSLLAISPTF